MPSPLGKLSRRSRDGCGVRGTRETSPCPLTYDEDGKLISVTTTGLAAESDTYENGNLIRSETGGNGTYEYEYNDNHLLTKIHNELITQTITYDEMGNATQTTLYATPAANSEGEAAESSETEEENTEATEIPTGPYLQTSAEYSTDGNLQTSITDSTGSSVTYAYGTDSSVMWGLPTTVAGPNNVETTTTYDEYGRQTEVSVENVASVLYNYSGGLLQTLTRHTDVSDQTYTFTYDAFGNVTSVAVGGTQLISNTYAAKNGQITQQTYGNGASVSYIYDNLGRIKTETFSDEGVPTCTRSYVYTGDGQLFSVTETKGGATTVYLYTYDTLGRLIGSEEKTGSTSVLRTHQTYNDKNQLTGQSWQMGSTAYADTFDYNAEDGSLNSHTTATGKTASYNYDSLRRLQSVEFTDLYTKVYGYRDIVDGQQTTTQVTQLAYKKSPTETLYQYNYAYDIMGNIATYTAGGQTLTYVYDTQGQLTQVSDTNGVLYTYTYDAAGNILTATKGNETHNYTYGNADWVDLLTNFHNGAIAYEGQTYNAADKTVTGTPISGNPISYYNGTRWTFDWQNGRRLATASDGTTNLSFAYDADGMRTAKTVNGVTHTYTYAGGKLMRETYGTNTLDFFYDASGMPYAIKYNNDLYYYITNLQGDILHIVNGSGDTIVSYEYDPYGKLLSTEGTMAETLGAANPLRYRGYYYDAELEMYYLQSRYYDPGVGRFINADGYVSTGPGVLEKNMFAYCTNNPVNMSDPSGEIAISTLILIGSIVAGVVVSGYTAYTSHKYTGKVDWKNTVISGLSTFSFCYTCGMSAYGMYISYCEYKGYTPVTEVKIGSQASNQTPTGPYSNLQDPSGVGSGKDFTAAQKAKIIQENMNRNNGVVRSDLSGEILVQPQKSMKGVTPPPNEWQIDHIIPKSAGGTNSYSNAQVLSRMENRLKWDR